MSQHHEGDMRAAYTGLLLGAVAVVLVVFTIVTLVNKSFADKPAAGHTTHQ